MKSGKLCRNHLATAIRLGLMALGASSLVACGGGSDGDSSSPAAAAISGTVASGAPLAKANVQLNCASGSGSAVTDANGAYSATFAFSPPCVVTATSADSKVLLHSIVTGSGTTNVTPLTELLVSYVAGQLGVNPFQLQTRLATDTALQQKLADGSVISKAQSSLVGMLKNNGITLSASANFLTTPFTADHTGADADLDKLKTAGAISSTGAVSQTVLDQAVAAGQSAATGGPATGPVAVLLPLSGATAAFVDSRLQITFNSQPTIGTKGYVKVFKADGTLVDTIDISGTPVTAGGETQTYMPAVNTEIDIIAKGVIDKQRYVYYTPITVSGTTATIRLHDGMLSYDTDYYVTVDNGVLNGVYNGSNFTGFTTAKAWTFHTKKAPASATSVVVDTNGGGDFLTVQGALDWVMQSGCTTATTCPNATAAKTITIKKGTYSEQLFLRNVNNLTIKGEDRAGVVITQDNSESYNPGSGGGQTAPQTTLTSEITGTRRNLGGGRAVFLVESCDLLTLTNFTLQNSHIKTAAFNNQAETIYYNSSSTTGSRMIATSMNFLSAQDTIQTKGWVWYYNSYIAGNVDFIWGGAFAALFENSELHTVADTVQPTQGGYIFQARVPTVTYPGFVVLNSTLTADAAVPAGSTYLARSGGSTAYFDNVAYINTKMGPHIATVGWSSTSTSPSNPLPNPGTATVATGWRESDSKNSAGALLSMTGRDTTNASNTLDLSGLNTRTQVFAGWNSNAGWNPTAP